jgi:acylphosphatase
VNVAGPEHPASAAVVRVHVVVTGRVQNVTFRASTRRRADELGVAGWARNLADGSVEAELEGPRPAVEELLGWMHAGPLLAGVDDVDVSVVAPRGEESFAVR